MTENEAKDEEVKNPPKVRGINHALNKPSSHSHS
jgi:hypothetical protein